MKLDEITIDGAPSHVHKIIKDAFLKAVRDVRVGEAFTPFHKHVKVKAQDNMVTVSFKTPSPHAPRSMRFAGGGKTQDELDFKRLQQAAKDVAEEMVFILGQEMNIEDQAIEAHNNSVTLFMVSDGFMGERVNEAKKPWWYNEETEAKAKEVLKYFSGRYNNIKPGYRAFAEIDGNSYEVDYVSARHEKGERPQYFVSTGAISGPRTPGYRVSQETIASMKIYKLERVL